MDEVDNASIDSEDSQEPYYHVSTGKIFPAREAWAVLAAEGHPRFQSKLNAGSSQTSLRQRDNDSIFRTPTEPMEDNAPAPPLLLPDSPPPEGDYETDLQQVASFQGPTQSSIDKALHPHSPNYISPQKDLKQAYKKSISNEGSIGMMDGYNSEEDDGETDPIILRAKASEFVRC